MTVPGQFTPEVPPSPALVAVKALDLLSMTDEERVALPPRFHVPTWDGMGTPHSWICSVCWGDGWQTSWPCEPATVGGLELAKASGLGWSW